MHFIKEKIAELSGILYDRGFNTLRDGNISSLVGTKIYITPTKSPLIGFANNSIKSNHIQIVDLSENKSSNGVLSSEWLKHKAVYLGPDAEVKAIIHCHAVYSTALASSSSLFNRLKVISNFHEYETYGLRICVSDEIVPDYNTEKELPNIVLTPFHGVTVFGRTLSEAYERIERMEHLSKIILQMK